MNTAQRVLGGAATTEQAKAVLPWIVGGLVVLVALLILGKE